MAISSKFRASLRARAHHLSATVHVGKHGFTPELVRSLDDALRANELVKVQLPKQSDTKARNEAVELARAVAAEVIQVIGKTVTLYRAKPEVPRDIAY
ncbi:MAG: YhbY family RNA-binding protein [Gemmatimonadaceae bacterium]